LVPGAGPTIEGEGWKVARHPKHRRRRKPYLTDNVELGRAFRKHYARDLKRLLRQGKLQIGGSVEFLNDPAKRDQWLSNLEQTDWNVFIEGPPKGKSDPANVVKYLAGYLTGGPISDRRIIRADDDEVWFWARPKRKSTSSSGRRRGMNKSEPYRLSSIQFMRRWAIHILPKGFTRSRCYGGYHGSKREAYLHRCRQLLSTLPDEVPAQKAEPDEDSDSSQERTCPHCESKMELIKSEHRPSWRKIFEREIYVSDVYCPQHHVGVGRSPPVKEHET
jgi:hypothetical protein